MPPRHSNPALALAGALCLAGICRVGGSSLPAARVRVGEAAPSPPEEYRPDLNHAPLHRLELLRGLGPVRAGALVAERARAGPFATFAEIADRVRGIGPATVDSLLRSASLGEPAPALRSLTVRLDQREDLE